jgi:methionyl-tRNA formyltransferase
VEILEDDKTPQIFEKFEKIGSNLLLNTLEMVVNNTIIPIKQDNSKATYCSKIEKED